MELFHQTAHELGQQLRKREISVIEVTESVLARIEALEPQIQAYITVTPDHARQMAKAAQARLDSGEWNPLLGIPVAIKDNITTKGIRTTCASKILSNYVPPYDATVVQRLKEAGAVIVGKANLDEFAMGSSTENSAFFPTRNPWDLERVPGGSSGGSAAAVAADETTLALGSDTGGSIRLPAALCGVVGLKPTYGRVSRYGLVAYASSLDQIGPITKDVTDCALLLQAICGKDPHDATCVDLPVPDFTEALCPDVKGFKLGVPKEFFAQGVQPEVASTVRRAIEQLVDAGATAEEISLPNLEYGLAAYYIIAPAEASSNLARYDGVKYGLRVGFEEGPIGMMEKTRAEGFGAEVIQRIMIGTYALSAGYYDAYYLKAQKVRTLIRRDLERAFERYDALLCPTSPILPFRLGEFLEDPLAMKLVDVLTIPVNLTGLPAISVPCGLHQGLPIGLQIIGKPFDESTVLQIAYTYEQIGGWQNRKPPCGNPGSAPAG